MSQSLDPDMEEPTDAAAKDKEDESPEKPMSQSLDPDMEDPTNAAAKDKEEKEQKQNKESTRDIQATASADEVELQIVEEDED